jgi:hypothetical protein
MVQDTASRKLDQYIVRFPEGMRDELKATAAKNNRSLNAEIVGRLEAYDVLHRQLIETAEERFRLEGELEATQAELKAARHEAEVASVFRDDLAYMSNLLRQMHEEDRATLNEVEEVIYFLEADRVRLEARVNEEELIPNTQDGPGPLKSRIARRLAWAVDERMALFARLVARLAPRWKSAAERRAQVAMHSIELSSYAREIAQIFVEEGVETDADFAEYVISMIESMPEERQAGYREGLRQAMPRLFNDWKSADPFFQ